MNKKVILILIVSLFIRFYMLGQNPPALYWDEVSLGYNAYSILKTARDEHNIFLPITNFAAFGDYKPPIYIYATVPSIAVFGLTEFALRFPSALAGTLMVFLTYLISKKLFENEKIALLSAFFLAISPWHVQLSRAAFEANLAHGLTLFAIFLFLKSQKEKSWLVILSAIFFALSLYTFTGQRLFVPFIVLILIFHYRERLLKNLKAICIAAIIGALITLPLLKFSLFTIEGKLRFNEVTIFKDLKPINDSIDQRSVDNFSWWSNIIHNRRLFFLNEYLKHYFDTFNSDFLFFSGDKNPRLSSQYVGQLYYSEILLIPLGLYFLIVRKQKNASLLFLWILVSPLGPASARETPHALRMIHILPTFQLISAFGLYNLLQLLNRRKSAILAIVFVTIYLVLTLNFLYFYFQKYPKIYAQTWQYGYKEAINEVKKYYDSVDNVVYTNELGRPYIYAAFYTKMEPSAFHQKVEFIRDSFFFYNVIKLDKFIFSSDLNNLTLSGKTLYVTTPNSLPDSVSKITTIKNKDESSVFDIGISQ